MAAPPSARPVPERLVELGFVTQSTGALQPPLVLVEACRVVAALKPHQGLVPVGVGEVRVERQGLDVGGLGRLGAVLPEQCDAQVAPAASHVGAQLHRLAVGDLRLGVLAPAHQHVAEGGPGLRHLRVQFQGAQARGLRLWVAPQVAQALAKVAVQGGDLRPARDGVLEGLHRLGDPSSRQQRQPQVGAGGEQAGVRRDGGEVGQDRPVEQGQDAGVVAAARPLLQGAAEIGVQAGDRRVQRDGGLVDRDRLGMAAEVGQGQGVVLQHLRVLGLQPSGLGVAGERQVASAERLVGGGQVGVRIGVARGQGEGAPIGGFRLGQAELAQPCVGQVVPAVRPVGGQDQRRLQRRFGRLHLPQFGERDAEVRVRLGVAGLQLDGAAKTLRRRLPPAERPQRHALVGVGRRQDRVQRAGLPRGRQSLVGPVETRESVGEVGEVGGGPLQRQGPAGGLKAFGIPALLLGDQAEHPPRLGRAWIALHRRPEAGHGLVQAAGAVLRQALGDQRGVGLEAAMPPLHAAMARREEGGAPASRLGGLAAGGVQAAGDPHPQRLPIQLRSGRRCGPDHCAQFGRRAGFGPSGAVIAVGWASTGSTRSLLHAAERGAQPAQHAVCTALHRYGVGHDPEGRLAGQHLADDALGLFGVGGAVDQPDARVGRKGDGGEGLSHAHTGTAAGARRPEPRSAEAEPGNRRTHPPRTPTPFRADAARVAIREVLTHVIASARWLKDATSRRSSGCNPATGWLWRRS